MRKIFKWSLIGFLAFVLLPYAIILNNYASDTREEEASIVATENERFAYDHWVASHKNYMKSFGDQVKQASNYGINQALSITIDRPNNLEEYKKLHTPFGETP